MKKYNNLYNNICDLDNIYYMTNLVCSKVRNKRKVGIFELKKSEHIINIKNRLESRDFNFSKYNIFMISDPKYRIIMNTTIEDKIINHLISDYILSFIYEKRFDISMSATRIGKGTVYALKLLKKYLNIEKMKYNTFYYLKLDIKKYFYNINHDILKRILRKKIKDKDALNILESIIDSTNYSYINKRILYLKEEKITYLKNSNLLNKERLIEEIKSIPLYKLGKGVALGNETAQLFGLIYVLEIINYIKEELYISKIVNFMDDFIIIHHDKEYLEYCLCKIKDKLSIYRLELNTKKTKIDNINNGISFLGYNFLLLSNKVIMKIGNKTKMRFKKKTRDLKILLNNKIITKKEFNILLAGYKGILNYGNCKSLYYKNIK